MYADDDWKFVFTWKIENWKMLRVKELDSPIFIVDQLPHKRWHLKICMEGPELSLMSFELHRAYDVREEQNKPVTLSVSMEIVSRYESRNRKEEVPNWNMQKYLRLFNEQLELSEVAECVQDDVLTLKCTMWGGHELDDPEPSEVEYPNPVHFDDSGEPATEEWYDVSRRGSYLCRPTSCTVRTRIQIFRRSFFWTVKDLDLKDPSGVSSIRIESSLKNVGSMILTFMYKRDASRFLGFEVRRIVPDYNKRTFAKCSLTFVGENRIYKIFSREGHLFPVGSDDPWVLTSLLEPSKNTLTTKHRRNWIRDLIHEGNMKIQVEMTIAHEGCYHHCVGSSTDSLDVADSILMKDIRQMNQDVVRLVAENGEVHVSRIILCIHSPVFSNMFLSDMSESKTNHINMPDVDVKILDLMVKFMSGDNLVLTPEVAVGLYQTAHKYDVPPLMALCLEFLMFNLTVEIVPDVLVMADVYGELELEKCVKDFMVSRLPQVLHTEQWKNLMESRLDFATKTGLQVLREKMGDVRSIIELKF